MYNLQDRLREEDRKLKGHGAKTVEGKKIHEKSRGGLRKVHEESWNDKGEYELW